MLEAEEARYVRVRRQDALPGSTQYTEGCRCLGGHNLLCLGDAKTAWRWGDAAKRAEPAVAEACRTVSSPQAASLGAGPLTGSSEGVR